MRTNIKEYFHIKGSPGLWKILSYKNKNISFRRFSTGQTTVVSLDKTKITNLGNYVFYLLDGTTVDIESIFSNIRIFFKDNIFPEDLNNIDKTFLNSIMLKIVPSYDPELFKFHHMILLLKFYKEFGFHNLRDLEVTSPELSPKD